MFARLLLIGFALSAGIRCAEAGMILDDDCLVVSVSELSVEDFYPEQQDDPSNYLRDGGSNDFSATAYASGPVNGYIAVASCDSLLLPRPISGAWLSLSNSRLPLNPVLDGLLKPS